jgi:hypothetical protein
VKWGSYHSGWRLPRDPALARLSRDQLSESETLTPTPDANNLRLAAALASLATLPRPGLWEVGPLRLPHTSQVDDSILAPTGDGPSIPPWLGFRLIGPRPPTLRLTTRASLPLEPASRLGLGLAFATSALSPRSLRLITRAPTPLRLRSREISPPTPIFAVSNSIFAPA